MIILLILTIVFPVLVGAWDTGTFGIARTTSLFGIAGLINIILAVASSILLAWWWFLAIPLLIVAGAFIGIILRGGR